MPSQACHLFVSIPFVREGDAPLDAPLHENASPALKRAYVDALVRELEGFDEDAEKLDIVSVTLGTGSTSTLPANELRRLLAAIERTFPTSHGAPIFAAFDPGLLSIGQLNELRALGTPFLEFRYFSSNAREADALGRPPAEVEMKKTDVVLDHVPVGPVGMQIAIGVAGQTAKSLEKTLRDANRANVARFELVPLRRDVPDVLSDDERAHLYRRACAWLDDHGFERTAPLRFARDGADNPCHRDRYAPVRSRTDCETLSIGPSTLSCSGGLMWANGGNLARYLQSGDDGSSVTECVVELDGRAIALRAQLDALYRGDAVPCASDAHRQLVAEGLLETHDGGAASLSDAGCLRFLEVFERLAAERP